MNKEHYKMFEEKYLKRFTKYYKEANTEQKKEVKRSIFDNPNLTIDEKETFWEEVRKGGKKSEQKNNRRK